MAKDSDLDKDNNQDSLFRRFMESDKQFKPLSDSNKHPAINKSPLEQASKTQPNQRYYSNNQHDQQDQEDSIPLSYNLARPTVTSEQYVEHFQVGLQNKAINQLKKGEITIQASIDLHAMTKDQASNAFSKFMISSYKRQLRCICIVHGKGTRGDRSQPILKNLVYNWIYEFSDIILGFCSCPAKFGGTGAILVLLKRNKNFDKDS